MTHGVLLLFRGAGRDIFILYATYCFCLGELVGKVEEDTEHGVAEMYTAYRNKLLIGHCHLPNNHKARSLKVPTTQTLINLPFCIS